jgi:hypothetical protein
MAVKNPGETVLQTPLLPWSQTFKNISLCVEFLYLLPTYSTSRLEVYSETSSSKGLLWFVSGYQGITWGRARIPVKSKEAFKIIFKGTSTVNGSITLAIKNFYVSTEACQLIPVFATPGNNLKYPLSNSLYAFLRDGNKKHE